MLATSCQRQPAPKSDAVSKGLRLAQASTKSACWGEPSLDWINLRLFCRCKVEGAIDGLQHYLSIYAQYDLLGD